VPVVLEAINVPDFLQIIVDSLRWVVLWLLLVVGLAVVYRFAPDRDAAKWRWVSWGSAIAALLWVLGSVLFALYVRNSGSYNETYGALGGVVILLMWFYLSGFVVILGAEINSEMEHQTRRDTTKGPQRPLGERGAYVADTVGESRG
jgi:membrane protein